MHPVLELAARFQPRQVQQVGDDPGEPNRLSLRAARRTGEPPSGSSCHTFRSVSAAAWIDAAGVFNSWDAFATKSRRTESRRRASVTSAITASTDPSVPVGVAVTRSQRVGAPSRSRQPRPARSRWRARSLRGGSEGRPGRACRGRAPRWRSSASVRERRLPLAVEQEDSVLHRREDLISDVPRFGRGLRLPLELLHVRVDVAPRVPGRRGAASTDRPTHPRGARCTDSQDDRRDAHIRECRTARPGVHLPVTNASARIRRRATRLRLTWPDAARSPDVHVRSTERPPRLPSIRCGQHSR